MSISANKSARLSAAILLCAAALFTSGCSSFNREWKKAGQSVPANDLSGRWQGVWVSETSGHTDQLRCIVTRQEDGTCLARFHAKYQKVLSFGYTVPLKVEPSEGSRPFSGEADLGWLAGGVYQYEGRADATNFFSTYSSKYDQGTFHMTRPDVP